MRVEVVTLVIVAADSLFLLIVLGSLLYLVVSKFRDAAALLELIEDESRKNRHAVKDLTAALKIESTSKGGRSDGGTSRAHDPALTQPH